MTVHNDRAWPKRTGRRRAVFRLEGRFDGTAGATITITPDLFTVRPLRRRAVAELALADVARGVIFEVSKLAARERRQELASKRKARPA
jgi:hypothetical protein